MMNLSKQQHGTTKSSGIQVIARAGAIMRILASHSGGLSLAAIASNADLPRSTVQRIINALVEERMVESKGHGEGYTIGSAFGQLMSQVQADITSIVDPYMTELLNRTQETVCLSSLSQDKVHVIDRKIAERELRVVFPVGIKAPAHASSAGKILLAGHTDHALTDILPEQLAKSTESTLNLAQTIAQLGDIRRTGFASDYEEYIEGICSFSVSIETYLGTYALSIISPSPRVRENAFREALFEVKNQIEQSVG